jgi:hypothetical protein
VRRGCGDVCGHAGASPRALGSGEERSDGGGSESTAQPGSRAAAAAGSMQGHLPSGTLDAGFWLERSLEPKAADRRTTIVPRGWHPPRLPGVVAACAGRPRCRRARVMPVAPGVAHEEQRSLEDMGFAVLRGCLDQHTIADMQEVLDRLTHPGSLAPGETFYDNRDEVRGAGDGSQLTAFGDHQLRLSNLQRRHEVFHQLIDHPRVLPLLHQYMREPRLAGDWHIRKECGPRSSWWHRGTGIDGWRVHPHDQRRRLSKQLNVAWLLDDQASGEGCLLVWPRSHLRDFHGSTLNQLSHDFPGLALEGSIEVEGKAGDAVIFVSVDSTSFLRSVSMAFLPHATCRFWAVLIVAAPISNAD